MASRLLVPIEEAMASRLVVRIEGRTASWLVGRCDQVVDDTVVVVMTRFDVSGSWLRIEHDRGGDPDVDESEGRDGCLTAAQRSARQRSAWLGLSCEADATRIEGVCKAAACMPPAEGTQ